MRKIKINLKNFQLAEIKEIAAFFKKGKVAAYPTDTIYGLGCLISAGRAVKKVYKIKGRDKNKPLIILVSGLAMAKKYCCLSGWQENFLKKVWPGPVTAVLKSRKKFLNFPPESGLAVRAPKNKFLQALFYEIKEPLISTSLNLSGRPPLCAVKDLDQYFKKEKPDMAVDAGFLRRRKPSRLVDLREGKVKVLRK